MIDPSLRNAAVRTHAADPPPRRSCSTSCWATARTDPAGGLAEALAAAQREARAQGRTLALIGHVCGTDGDPQDRAAQIRQLEAAGAIVADSNYRGGVARGASGRSASVERAMSATTLFKDSLSVINVGLAGFGEDIVAAGGACVALDWQPPAQGDRDAAWALATIFDHPRVEEANAVAFSRFAAAQPVLVDVAPARDVLPGMAGGRRLILHAGPPIAWPKMCGPMQGAILGAAVLEGWADSVDAASRLVERGGVELEPCHHHGAVGPMAGIISPSMPLWVVENKAQGNRAYSNFNEGLGKVLRFGANGPEVIDRLRWIARDLAPTLRATLARTGGIELMPLMAQALNMGDEVHNRNAAATALSVQAPRAGDVRDGRAARRRDEVARVHRRQRPLLPQPVDGRVQGDARRRGRRARTARWSSRWRGTASTSAFASRAPASAGSRRRPIPSTACTSPATRSPMPPPISAIPRSRRPPASAASRWPPPPRSSSSSAARRPMPRTTACGCARSRSASIASFTLPSLDFAPAAAGIDARKVVDSGILPVINSGIAHRQAGVGQIGAGVTYAPMACFAAAVKALARADRRRSGSRTMSSAHRDGRRRRQRAHPRRAAHLARRTSTTPSARRPRTSST